MIYELWTRRKAFDSKNVETLRQKVISGKPPRIQHTSQNRSRMFLNVQSPLKTKINFDSGFSDFDEDLEKIYLWWVQKDPAKRPNVSDLLCLSWVKSAAKRVKVSLPIKYVWKTAKEIPELDENDYVYKYDLLESDTLDMMNTNESLTQAKATRKLLV